MIKGSITALVTPFKNGGLDETAFQDFVEWQIASGTHGLVPCGTTGESATLTDEEHRRVISLCVEAANGRVPVIAGAGSNETVVSISYAKHAKDLGADAALVVTPYYNKPNQEGIYQHFKAIAEAVDIPIVVYNIPGRSVVDISNETMGRDLCGDDFIQLSGDDASTLGHGVHGGRGAITVVANVAPKLYADFQNACLSGDFLEARRINTVLDRLHHDLFMDPNPSPTKYALSLMGKMSDDVRLPMTRCSEPVKRAVEAAMTRAGITW